MEPAVVTFTRNAPMNTLGTSRKPNRRNAAIATPVGKPDRRGTRVNEAEKRQPELAGPEVDQQQARIQQHDLRGLHRRSATSSCRADVGASISEMPGSRYPETGMSFRFWERDETLVMIVTRGAAYAS